MSKELLLVVDVVVNEKGVLCEVIFDVIEVVLVLVVKKCYFEEEVLICVVIDYKDGSYEIFCCWEVVVDDVVMELLDCQICLMDVVDEVEGVEVGDYIEEQIENLDFGCIVVQVVKQVIVQCVCEVECQQVVDVWKDCVGELIIGVVKCVECGNIYVDFGGNVEGFILKDKGILCDVLCVGDCVCGYLVEVCLELCGLQLFISCVVLEFMIELFKLEVLEVGQGLVEIKVCVCDLGDCVKIVVLVYDQCIDLIGVCIGMCGLCVQVVFNEFNGECVDIVLWNDNLVNFVINVMVLVEVQLIIVDEDKYLMDLVVVEDCLVQVIGKGGQNVCLVSCLIGWQFNVMIQDQVIVKLEVEQVVVCQLFMDKLEVDEEIVGILVSEGFGIVEEIVYVLVGELLVVEGFDEDIVEELCVCVCDVLFNEVLVVEEGFEDGQLVQDLLFLKGMDEVIVYVLVGYGVCISEDLFDLVVDEVMDFGIEGLDQVCVVVLILVVCVEEIV